MLVSLSSYCQYPAIKTIGKDTVVIMTVKQGQEINETFSVLKDSIGRLNNSLTETSSELFLVKNKSLKLDSTLKVTSSSLLISEEEIKRLNSLVKKNESTYWQEKKIWAGWMFFSVVVTVMLGVLK